MVRKPFGSRHNGTQTVQFSAQWYANRLVPGTMVHEPYSIIDLECISATTFFLNFSVKMFYTL